MCEYYIYFKQGSGYKGSHYNKAIPCTSTKGQYQISERKRILMAQMFGQFKVMVV